MNYSPRDRGIYLLGTVTSNSAKQVDSAISYARKQPIIDLLTSFSGRMSDEAFQRSQLVNQIVLDRKCLTLYAHTEHESSFRTAGNHIVQPECFIEIH